MSARLWIIRAFAAAVIAVSAALLPFNALGDNIRTTDSLYSDDRDTFDKLNDFQNENESPYQEIPRGHWTYEAVRHFAELGLLDGYDGTIFSDGKTITRLEMAAYVSNIFTNYAKWEQTGTVTRYKKITTEKPTVEPAPGAAREDTRGRSSELIAAAPEPEQALKRIKAPPALITSQPTKQVTIQGEGGPVTLYRTTPRAMGVPEPETDGTALPGVDTFAQPQQKKPKPGRKDETQPPAPQPAPVPPEFEERVVRVEEKIELTQKDIDTVENLVNDFKKELKEIDKNFQKNLKEVERITLTNKRQIEALTQEDERFKITGSDDFVFQVSGPYEPVETTEDIDIPHPDNPYYPYTLTVPKDRETTLIFNKLSLRFDSKPVPTEDLKVMARFEAKTHIGSRRGYYGYISGTNTALSVEEFRVGYTNSKEDPQKPKNFKLRSLNIGDIGVSYSPLTMFGYNVQGMNAALKLNDYTINMFGGRVAYHYPLFLGQMPFQKPGDTTQYDRYVYGFNLNSAIFGEPASMGNIQKIFMYDNPSTNYYGRRGYVPYAPCDPGWWIETGYWNDPSAPFGGTTNEFYKDMFCLPPEKNSVTSVFVRYPLIGSLNITAEYAHSTYYKPAYKMIKDVNQLPKDIYDVLVDTDGDGIKERIFVPDGYELCDTDDITKKYDCWFDSKERVAQDDGFLILFDFTRGPIKVFPLGYARLGPEFVTKYFGLPGMDTSSFGGGGAKESFETSSGGLAGGLPGLSFLPISIQSIELYIANFTLDKIQTDNYSYTTYYGTGGETQPMYFDPGLVAYGLSNTKDKGASLGVLGQFILKLNTRRGTLNLNLWNNDFKYYISDDISFNFKHTRVTVALPQTCLDGNIVTLTDDHGNVIDKFIGDGKYECGVADSDDPYLKLDARIDNQEYRLNWKTSKNATLQSSVKITNIKLTLDFPSVPAVSALVLDLAPHGKYYTMFHQLDYKLTKSTSVQIAYEKTYDFPQDTDTNDEGDYPVVDNHTFKFKVSTQF